MVRGAWWAIVHGVAKSQTQLSMHTNTYTHTHRVKGAGRLAEFEIHEILALLVAQSVKNLPAVQETWVQSLGWEDPLGRKWHSPSVFLPGESHGQRSLAG